MTVKRTGYRYRVVTLLAVAAGVLTAQGCGRNPLAKYSLDVAYAALPADDEALGRWLRYHDGWRDPTVTRAGNEIKVRFGSDRPPSPAALRAPGIPPSGARPR